MLTDCPDLRVVLFDGTGRVTWLGESSRGSTTTSDFTDVCSTGLKFYK